MDSFGLGEFHNSINWIDPFRRSEINLWHSRRCSNKDFHCIQIIPNVRFWMFWKIPTFNCLSILWFDPEIVEKALLGKFYGGSVAPQNLHYVAKEPGFQSSICAQLFPATIILATFVHKYSWDIFPRDIEFPIFGYLPRFSRIFTYPSCC